MITNLNSIKGLTRRQRAHQSTRDEILQTARQQMTEQGAAALSLRAIARRMRMTAPALYRYFSSRDDLVTALIVTAYHSLADALLAARDSLPANDPASRLLAMCLAYREWALAHPQDYALIFGTPIPGYQAPSEITMPAAKRSMDAFVGALRDAQNAGQLSPDAAYAKPLPAVQTLLSRWKKNYGYAESTVALHFALVGWSRMHGLVLLELFDHIQPFWSNPEELYRAEVLSLLKQVGLASNLSSKNRTKKSRHKGNTK